MALDKIDNRVVDLITALINMDRLKIREILNPEDGVIFKEQIIDTIIVPALDEIGKRWEEGTVAISQVYMAGILIEEMISSMVPDIKSNLKNEKKLATVVLEDYHMLGERIVSAYLIGAGYTPIRYGRRNVQEVLSLVSHDNIKYLIISTLMLPSALRIKEVTTGLEGKGVKVIVGGAPFRFDPELGKEVGADRVCFTASDAVTAIRELEIMS
ncbi:cobalamin B12-binding domain-containing protein [Methanospirillum lacunae]|uniref:Cobalamin-binding protein n=1 Tax=Methanospirillum lacunae TaxID=668570 RepID=A0A2V2N1G9_9EURY|nr:cobalamin-dependent protein [Methanospirillum lacunae]PWR70368.1 cobalamin-binding protein [Methanospirillum lacunae]